MITTYKPTLQDLWFRQQFMADEATMSYNAAWGGTIPFPENTWKEWYDRWLIHHENKRFYRYLQDTETKEFVGEIAYHYDEEREIFLADVIVASEYRGRGYGSEGLQLLCDAAKANGVDVLRDDIAIDNPAAELFLKAGFTEEYRTDEIIMLKKNLKQSPRRIIVIGSPGSGKSTFARKLRDKMGLPLYYLDMIFHNPDRTTVSREEFDLRLSEILNSGQWIIDGNYQRTLPLRFEKCTEVFLFDLPVEQCLEGAALRIGQIREDMPWVEKEFDPEFRQYILDFQKDQMPRINELIEQYKDSKTVTIFHSREEADNWINWQSLSHAEKNHQLFLKQKALLDQFLEKGAISQAQHDKSLHDLIEKMGETC